MIGRSEREGLEAFASAASERLRDAFRDAGGFDALFAPHVEWRIKSDASIAAKQARRMLKPSTPVNDLIGIRVILSHVGLLPAAAQIVRHWLETHAALHIVEHADYLATPISQGHRAVHIDAVLSPGHYADMARLGGVEVQIISHLHFLLSAISHRITYDPQARPQLSERALTDLAARFAMLEAEVTEIAARLDAQPQGEG